MNPLPTRALSIRQPWAWLIVHGPKRFENREWSEGYPARHFRGPFLIHAAQGMTRDEYAIACIIAEENGVQIPAFSDLERGGIIGTANVVNFVEEGSGPWAFTSGLELAAVLPLPFKPCKGSLGFFHCDYNAL